MAEDWDNGGKVLKKSKEIVRQFLRFYIMAESIEENILLCSLLYYNEHRNSRVVSNEL